MFLAANPPQPVRTVPTSDDVVALQAAARDDPMEGLFVELLVTTGIRAEAFANMRWMHLWADGPRTPLCIPEKNSDVRRIMPGDALQCAIRRAHSFASTAQHDGVAVFVFRHPLHHGIPWLGCARTLLVRLCKRMGLHGRGIFTPHQFRAYLVNAAMARGCSLEAVSKWFGHRNVNVTYRYYWTAPSPLPVAACVVVDATPPSTRTASCMHPQSLPPLEPATDADPLERLFGCFP